MKVFSAGRILVFLVPLWLAVPLVPAFGQQTGGQSAGIQAQDGYAESTVPLALGGIWQNDARYVVFGTGYLDADGGDIPQIALRTFYQWYVDRAAESLSYTAQVERDRNDTSDLPAQELTVRYVPLTYEAYPAATGIHTALDGDDVLYASDVPSGAWDIQIVYPGKKDVYHVPVAVIGSNLYLDFVVKDFESATVSSGQELLSGYWRDWGKASGILISPPYNETELLSYYVADGAVYYIRYWETGMEFDADAVAVFSDGTQAYEVPKHLQAQGKVYTCVNGRSTRIRNITKGLAMPSDITLNSLTVERHGTDADGNAITWTESASTICALGEPYLTLTDGTRTMEQIVSAANSRRKPPAPSPFPPHGILDFDWSIVERPPQNWFKRNSQLGK